MADASWSDVKTVLNAIISEAPPSRNATHVNGPFRVMVRGLPDDGQAVHPRSFEWRAQTGAVRNPGCFIQKGRMRVEGLLRLMYPGRTVRDEDELDSIMVSDVEDCVQALLDEDNLPPTRPSPIHLIGVRDSGGVETLPFDISPLDGGGFVAEIQASIIYHRGPAA